MDWKSTALKALVWSIPVIFGAGGLISTVSGAMADVEKLTADVEDHVELPAHPITAERLVSLEEGQTLLIEEQQKFQDAQQVQAINIAAICQATGANCR